jgi:ElaB/YqjD/DUF883 family membrane-anchored ribosome-binding protein
MIVSPHAVRPASLEKAGLIVTTTRRRDKRSRPRTFAGIARCLVPSTDRSTAMPDPRNPTPDFNRAFGDAKKNAAGVADQVSDAASELYGHARDSASQVADATSTAARKTAGSFEKALRNTIETQPYTAVAIALGLGWLLGRMHRPL